MNQLGFPSVVSPAEIERKKSLGAAIELCVEVGGYEAKALQIDLGVDKAQYSRWLSEKEGVMWPKLVRLMDHCGNDAPLLWMLHARGYDLHSLRKRETEMEQQLRATQEALDSERQKNKVLVDAINGKSS